jgi:hypothetical protein
MRLVRTPLIAPPVLLPRPRRRGEKRVFGSGVPSLIVPQVLTIALQISMVLLHVASVIAEIAVIVAEIATVAVVVPAIVLQRTLIPADGGTVAREILLISRDG